MGVTAGAAAGEPAPADTLPVYTIPPMVVEGERDESVTALPGPRTVLDRAWLERRDPVTVSNALLPVPGLRLRGFGDGVSSFASVRGLGPERVAVLIDGRPVNTAQSGGVDLQPLDVEGLERVELLRGSMGAAYGPDAMAGAINLVRRNDRRSYLSFRAMAGTEEVIENGTIDDMDQIQRIHLFLKGWPVLREKHEVYRSLEHYKRQDPQTLEHVVIPGIVRRSTPQELKQIIEKYPDTLLAEKAEEELAE